MHAERALWNRLFTAMFWRNAGTSVILAPLLLTSAMAPPVPLSAILAFTDSFSLLASRSKPSH
eukprot:265503-Amphidinium_carterae.1